MTLVWPAVDEFTEGSVPYGDSVRGYLRAIPQSGDAYVLGHLVDTYAANGVSGNTDAGLTSGAGRCAFLRREVQSGDLAVRGTFQLLASGAANAAALLEHGVIVSSASSVSQPETYGVDASLDDVDGYVFRIRNVSGVARFQLLRLGPNAATLADEPVTDSFDIDYGEPHTLELRATTSRGEVTLQCLVTAVVTLKGPGGSFFVNYKNTGGPGGTRTFGSNNVGGSSAPDGVPVKSDGLKVNQSATIAGLGGKVSSVDSFEVFSFTDSGGSALTADGRAGFTIGTEQILVANQVISLCREFSVSTLDAAGNPTVVWLDDWTRATRVGSASIPSSLPAFSGGRSLEGDYTRDGGSDVANQSASTSAALLRDAGNDRAEVQGAPASGDAITFDGTTASANVTAAFGGTSIPIPDPTATFLTFAVWARPTGTIRDGCELWANLREISAGNWVGISFGLEQFNASLVQPRFRYATGAAVIEETPVSQTQLDWTTAVQDEPYLYAMVYEATGSAIGTPRARVYRGRQGAVELIGTFEPAVAPSLVFPPLKHVLGRREGFTGSALAVDLTFAGELDSPVYFQRALTLTELSTLANESLSAAQLAALEPTHASTFDDNDYTSGAATWQNEIPVGESIPWDSSASGTSAGPAITTDALVALRHFWHRRTAASMLDQRRSALVTLGNDTNIVGVMLRGALPGTSESLFSGYLVTVRAGTPAAVDVYRSVVSGPDRVDTAVGRQASSSTVDVASGTAFELDVQAEEQASGGPAVLTVRIDGAQVPLQAISAAGQTSTDPIGRLIDAPAVPITGAVTGFAVASATNPVLVDTWTDSDPADPPGASSSAALIIPSEEDLPAFGNLTDVVPPDSRIEYRAVHAQTRIALETGHKSHLALTTYAPRVLRVTITNPTASELSTLRDFIDEHDVAQAFRFDASRYRSRAVDGMFVFLQETIDEFRRVVNASRYELTLREVRRALIDA